MKPDAEQGYREVIAEMRAELVDRLRMECRDINRERKRGDRKFAGFARKRAKPLIRRIRALDAMVAAARQDVCEVCELCLIHVRGPRCEDHVNSERFDCGHWDCEGHDDAAAQERR